MFETNGVGDYSFVSIHLSLEIKNLRKEDPWQGNKMKERGLMSGFLISKLGIILVAICLIGSATATYKSIERTNQRKKLRYIVETVATTLREIDSLPGNVRMERKLPLVEGVYKLTLTGEKQDYQIVKICLQSGENVHETLFLEQPVNGGEFKITERNPQKLVITKTDGISVEVV